MSNEFLSQEQIDMLLGQQTNANAPLFDSDASAGGVQRNYTALTAAFEVFTEQAGAVISTVLNKDTSFKIDNSAKADINSIKTDFPDPILALEMPFESGLSGTAYLLITKKDVALFSDIMMMGDGSAEYVEDHKDAISELFSQVIGAFSTSMGAKINSPVKVGALAAKDFDLASPPIDTGSFDAIKIAVKIAGVRDTSVVMLVSEELGSQCIAKFAAQGGSSDDGSQGQQSDSDFANAFGDNGSGNSTFLETGPADSHFGSNASKENIDMLLDVDLDVCIELGRANLSIKRILELSPGSVVELDRMAGEPVDLLVNNKVVAKGEVVVVDENFGIRIVSLMSPEERIKSLK